MPVVAFSDDGQPVFVPIFCSLHLDRAGITVGHLWLPRARTLSVDGVMQREPGSERSSGTAGIPAVWSLVPWPATSEMGRVRRC